MSVKNPMARTLATIATIVTILSSPAVTRADGMDPDFEPKAVAPVAHRMVEPEPMAQSALAIPMEVDSCYWMARFSLGVPVWFFQDENTLPGAGAALDLWRTDYPINFRIGIEGRHMYLGQEQAQFAQEFSDKTTRVTFLRIPFSLEYMQPIAEDTTWYIGGGPDIIHTANDIGETSVGMHLSTRLHYAFDQRFGASVEAGYMWGSLDGRGKNINLDNMFIMPALTYTF